MFFLSSKSPSYRIFKAGHSILENIKTYIGWEKGIGKGMALKKSLITGCVTVLGLTLTVTFLPWLKRSLTLHAVSMQLSDSPSTITKFNEIAIKYAHSMVGPWNNLTPQERVFCYYFFRAALPGNLIAADCLHREAVAIQQLFEDIVRAEKVIRQRVADGELEVPVDAFMDQVKTYLVYILTNHSQYFLREGAESKRTPEKLGLHALTEENLLAVIRALGLFADETILEQMWISMAPALFDLNFERTLTVPGSIDKSAVNFYAADFTDADFATIPLSEQHQVNRYFEITYDAEGNRIPTSVVASMQDDGKYNAELSVVCHWLSKAYEHALKYPEQFDEHFVESLKYLIQFFETGEEELFKKYSIAWLKSNSRLDYSFGFVETYHDPKGFRGDFQADINVKSFDMKKINAVLPGIEDRLPLPAEFKRIEKSLPNASINTKVFTAGDLGPLNNTLAYCLPNYDEIRTNYGSKQIIYISEPRLGQLLNPELYEQLFFLPERLVWHKKYDPHFELDDVLNSALTILHETIGHGSGALSKGVTTEILRSRLSGYEHTLEELRAEIIAIYGAIFEYDELARVGVFGSWPQKISKEVMIEHLIEHMCYSGLRRLVNEQDGSDTVSGDHSRADYTILTYILESGAVEVVMQPVTIDGKEHKVLGLKVKDVKKASERIQELMIMVQTIKSTADKEKCAWLIDTYGTKIRNKEYVALLKQNTKAVMGELKVSASIYPDFEPVMEGDQIVDVKATWPSDFIEQYLRYSTLSLAIE